MKESNKQRSKAKQIPTIAEIEKQECVFMENTIVAICAFLFTLIILLGL